MKNIIVAFRRTESWIGGSKISTEVVALRAKCLIPLIPKTESRIKFCTYPMTIQHDLYSNWVVSIDAKYTNCNYTFLYIKICFQWIQESDSAQF